MGIVRKSSDLDQSGHALFGAHQETAPLSRPEAARSAVFAALGGLVEAGLATWNERCANTIKLRGICGEVWLLGDSGVTRLR
jgi:hypothetical protein